MLELPPEKRIITLSPRQRRLFRDVFLKIASESSKGGSLGAAAASAWLTIQLVTVMRWLVGQRHEPIKGGAEVDPQCFALWQKIHEHAHQTTSAEPMLFSKDASYDSLRHRFRSTFGISPRGLLVRLRMNRAKELLRTSSDISIKELAQELGYTKQHEFTRAFHRFFGIVPVV